MKLSFFNVNKKETLTYKGDASIYNELNKSSCIKSFNSINGKILVDRYEEVVVCRFKITANLVVLSSLTNEPFNYKLKIDDVLCYTRKESYAAVEKDIILTSENYIDLEEVIYSLVITNLPTRLVKKSETYPQGEHYRVISEEEYFKSKEKEENESPFDALKDLDFDDQEEESDN